MLLVQPLALAVNNAGYRCHPKQSHGRNGRADHDQHQPSDTGR